MTRYEKFIVWVIFCTSSMRQSPHQGGCICFWTLQPKYSNLLTTHDHVLLHTHACAPLYLFIFICLTWNNFFAFSRHKQSSPLCYTTILRENHHNLTPIINKCWENTKMLLGLPMGVTTWMTLIKLAICDTIFGDVTCYPLVIWAGLFF